MVMVMLRFAGWLRDPAELKSTQVDIVIDHQPKAQLWRLQVTNTMCGLLGVWFLMHTLSVLEHEQLGLWLHLRDLTKLQPTCSVPSEDYHTAEFTQGHNV